MNICVIDMFRLQPYEINKKAMRNSLVRFGKRGNLYQQYTESPDGNMDGIKKSSNGRTNNPDIVVYFLDTTN
uniref:Piwi domain-containing protein n=1 Tax=Strongyloides papillosus TaxID=174720 RepID=A0A0N5BVK7_STREA